MGAGRSTVSVPFSGFHAHFVLWFAGYAQRTFTCSLPRRKSTGSVQRPSGAPRLHTVMYALCAVLRPSETHVSAQKMEDAMKRAKLAQEQLKKAQAEAEKLKNQNKKT